MAEAYDVLAGLNRILESQERREQTKLQTSLAMMQFAQQKRMQDIQVTGQQLQLLQTANEQLTVGLADDFLQRSGLNALYAQYGGEDDDGFKNAVLELTKKPKKSRIGLGLNLNREEASKIASAVWAVHQSKNPKAILSIASSLKGVEGDVASGLKPPDSDVRLYAAFGTLGYFDDPSASSQQLSSISKALQNRQDITAEMLEFGKGDFDIQRDIKVYEPPDQGSVDSTQIASQEAPELSPEKTEEFNKVLEDLLKRAEISSINVPQSKHTSQEIEESFSAFPETSRGFAIQKLDDLDEQIETKKGLLLTSKLAQATKLERMDELNKERDEKLRAINSLQKVFGSGVGKSVSDSETPEVAEAAEAFQNAKSRYHAIPGQIQREGLNKELKAREHYERTGSFRLTAGWGDTETHRISQIEESLRALELQREKLYAS